MPASITTANAILKEVYEGKLREQINQKVKLLTKITNVSTRVGAKYVAFPVHTTRNSGVGARRENETLPSAGNQGTEQARVSMKYLYSRIQLSGPSIELIGSDFNSFQDLLELETSYLRKDMAVDLNRQMYGNGTGAIGATSTVGAATVATITSGIDNFQVGMVVDVYTSANFAAEGAVKQTVTVTAVGATTVTVSASVTFAAGDVFVRTGNINREITGLGAIVSDVGLLYNINPTTVPVWAASVNANGGTPRTLGESMMITMADTIVKKAGESPNVAFTSLGVRRAYFNLLEQQREFSNTSTFTGGFGGLKFMTDDGEIPIVSDKDCPPGTMYFLNTGNLKIYQQGDWSFLDRMGSKWQQVPNTDAFSATMYRYMEMATDQRNAHGKIVDITEA